jgi:hypothetical protein
VPNLPFGSVSCTGVSLQRLTWLASAPFRARPPGPVSGWLSTAPPRRRDGTLTLVSRCLSAAGIRFSAILSRLVFRPSYDRPTGAGAPDHDGVSVFRTCEMRPEWAPSLPRDRRCSHGPPNLLARRLPPLCGTGPVPRYRRHPSGVPSSRGINEGSRDSPARPSPHLWPPDDSGALGLYPGLRTHASWTRARTPGRGQASSTSLELRRRHLRHVGPPICEFTHEHVRPHVARSGSGWVR